MRKLLLGVVGLFASSLLLGWTPQARAGWTGEDLGYLGSTVTEVNSFGELIGTRIQTGRDVIYTRSGQFLSWQSGVKAVSINDAGQVVLNYNNRVYLYSGGVSQLISSPSMNTAFATGINNSGAIAIDSTINGNRHFYIYQDGTMTLINPSLPIPGHSGSLNYQLATSINSAGDMAINIGYGVCQAPDGNGGCVPGNGGSAYIVRKDGSFTSVNSGYPDNMAFPPFARVDILNDKGQAIGIRNPTIYNFDPKIHHAFLWDNGQIVDLSIPGEYYSAATDINNTGQIIIESYDNQKSSSFYLYDNGVTSSLNDLLSTTFDWWVFGDAKLTSVKLADGIIAGSYNDYWGEGGVFTLRMTSPVDEPAPYALTLAGLSLLAAMRRRSAASQERTIWAN